MEHENGGNEVKEEEIPSSPPTNSKNPQKITNIEVQNSYTKKQWILLIFFSAINLLFAMTMSLAPPFYPAEAEQKGATAAEYGFVFGIFEFVVFQAAPIYGKYMNKFGPKIVFSISILVCSVATICFGCLHWVQDHTWFLTLSFICRIFEGLGCAGFFTSTFVTIACEFPQSVATTFASLETFIGLGFIVGPTVGGALYGLGGFPVPFIVVGTCLGITGLFSIFIMPITEKTANAEGIGETGYGIWTILKIPSIALSAFSIVATAMSLGFVSATLEPHIRRFGLTPLQTGLVFVINNGTYALSAPLWGYICDRIGRPLYVTILGNLLICISFMIIGPASFIPFDTILWVTIIGLLIQGLGFGCIFVSTFIIGLRDSIKNGLPDNLATYAVACGLWQSMISLGAWIGPSAGGLLYDTVGFREGSLLILIISFMSGLAIVMYICLSSTLEEDGESKPLLEQEIASVHVPKSLKDELNFDADCAVAQSTKYGST